MAITGFKYTGSQGSFSRGGQNVGLLVYDAYSDTYTDTEAEVAAFFKANGSLPSLDREHPTLGGYYCDQESFTRTNDSDPQAVVWRCSFRHSPQWESLRFSDETGAYTANPFDAHRVIQFDWAERTVDAPRAVFEGVRRFAVSSGEPISDYRDMPWNGGTMNGEFPKSIKYDPDPLVADTFGRICNSKGDAYDTPLDQRKVDMVMRVTLFLATINTAWRELFDFVNDDKLQITQPLYGIDETFEKRELLFHNFVFRPRFINATRLHETTFEFWYRQGGWREEILDEGLNASGFDGAINPETGQDYSGIEPGVPPTRKIKDRNDEPVVSPTLLDGSSQPYQGSTYEWFNQYRVQEKGPLNDLPVGLAVVP